MNEYIQSMAYKQWKNNKDSVIDALQELMGKEKGLLDRNLYRANDSQG